MYDTLGGIFNPSGASYLSDIIKKIFKILIEQFEGKNTAFDSIFGALVPAIAALLFLYFLITILRHASNGQITFEQILNSFIRLAIALVLLINIKAITFNLIQVGQIFEETVSKNFGNNDKDKLIIENYYIQIGTEYAGSQAATVVKQSKGSNPAGVWTTNLGLRCLSATSGKELEKEKKNGSPADIIYETGKAVLFPGIMAAQAVGGANSSQDVLSYTGPWITDKGNCAFSDCSLCKKTRESNKNNLLYISSSKNQKTIKDRLKSANFGDGLDDKWDEHGDLSKSHTAAHWALKEACAEEARVDKASANIPITIIAMIIKIGTMIIGFIGIIMAYKIAIEVLIRGVYMPFAIINIVQEGSSSVSIGYIKKFLACLLAFSIMLLVLWAGNKITEYQSVFSPAVSKSNPHPVLGWENIKSTIATISTFVNALVIKIAQVGSFGVAIKIANDIVG